MVFGYMVYSKADKLPLLPALEANPNSLSISGFSAGAFMTNQMHVAFSDTFKGAGMVAGGPYEVILSTFGPHENKYDYLWFRQQITSLDAPPQQLSNIAQEKLYFKYLMNQIDDPVHLKHAPVFVGIDKKDTIVVP